MKKIMMMLVGFLFLLSASARAMQEINGPLDQAKVESGRRFGEYGGKKSLTGAPPVVAAGAATAQAQLARAAGNSQAKLEIPKPASARRDGVERHQAKQEIISGLTWGGVGALALVFPAAGLALGAMALATGVLAFPREKYWRAASYLALAALAFAVPQAGALAAVALGASRLFYGLTRLFS